MAVAFAEHTIFSGDIDDFVSMVFDFSGSGRPHHHRYDYFGAPSMSLPMQDGYILNYRCVRAGCSMMGSWPLSKPHAHSLDPSAHVPR